MEAAYHRHDISDTLLGRLEQHLPSRKETSGVTARNNRQFINAVFWSLEPAKSLSNNRKLRNFSAFSRYAASAPPSRRLLVCVVGASLPIPKNLEKLLRFYCWIGS